MAAPVGSPPNPGLSRVGPFSPEYLGHYVHLLDKSPKMRAIRAIIDEVAPTDATVLLRGESGVGKGVVARALHAASRRHAQPFEDPADRGRAHVVAEAEQFAVDALA